MRSHLTSVLALAAVLAGCDGTTAASVDGALAVADVSVFDGAAPLDAAADATVDASVDAVVDAEPLDAGPADVGEVDVGEADVGRVDGALPDLGPSPDAGPAPIGDGCEVVPLLEQRCAQGGCHLPHNQRTSLVLTRSAIEAGALRGYVVPFDPDASYLVARMKGEGVGPLMPLGSITPIDELAQVEDWIGDGAPTHCDAEPVAAPPSDPNHLDPDALFTCDGPDESSTPSRIRRVGQREWTRAVVKPLSGTWWGSTAKDNPFTAPDGLPYSTWPADVTIDSATLDLYMLVLPEAPAIWNARDPRAAPGFLPGERTAVVYSNPALRCIFDDAAPDGACVDLYVGTLLRDGVLFRTPTDGEFARLRALLVQALADEPDPAARRATLQFVGEAAFLMAGALFRAELGAPVEGEDPDAPARLTADEMALALGRVLSSHPVGAPLPISERGLPDADDPMLGRLGRIRAAAEDGSIFEPEVISDLLAAYRGGVDPARADLVPDVDGRERPGRGEFWLAENVLQFFREWLDYSDADTAFKDTPSATSRWERTYNGDPMWDPTTVGYRVLQTGAPGYESTMASQLDDTIARAVIESHEQGDDVFARLMTTRTWRLPSNTADLSGIACDAHADCPPREESDYFRCVTERGVCGTSVASSTIKNNRVYGLDGDVAATPEGRWVEMPADQRAGVLTHPAWLAAHGGNFQDDGSAIHRGKWIRERLLCQTVPGLALVQAEAKLVESDPTRSARARLRVSIEDPEANPQSATCMGCHSLMNSLGYPFEIYNHAGFVRAFDHGPDGDIEPDGSSRITLAPEPLLDTDVADAVELAELLAESRVARRCFVRQAFRSFAGRGETLADRCVLTAMEAALDESGSFFDMLDVLVQSGAFQRRHGGDAR